MVINKNFSILSQICGLQIVCFVQLNKLKTHFSTEVQIPQNDKNNVKYVFFEQTENEIQIFQNIKVAVTQ